MSDLPSWAQEMRKLFRSGSTSQFVLYGSVHDLVPAPGDGGDDLDFVPLQSFLTRVMFEPFQVLTRSLQFPRANGWPCLRDFSLRSLTVTLLHCAPDPVWH